MEHFCRIGRGNLCDGEARAESKQSQRDQQRARPGRLHGKRFAQPAAGNRSSDAGEESAEFKDAIAPGEFLFRQQFRQEAIFRRAEEGAVHTHQKDA